MRYGRRIGGRSILLRAILLRAVLLCAIGCGGSDGPPAVQLENADVCSSAWQRFSAPQAFDVTSALLYQAGTLYYSSLNAKAVMAVPIDGSPPTALTSVAVSELWLEGDHLLFPNGELENQIDSLPLSGGTPQLVLDGAAGRTAPSLARAHAFTASDFYWVEAPLGAGGGPTTVWRQTRAGGTASQIGTVTFTVPGEDNLYFPGTAVALSGDALLVAAAFGQAATLPTGGGVAVALATPAGSPNLNLQSDLAGLDALGAYWSVPGVASGPASLMLSPADGSGAKPFWATLPATAQPVRIWPNPEGGWIVVSLQEFADGSHTTVTLLDPLGNATRLACSPGISGDSWIEKGVAVAPDAIYVPAENLSADTWEIDRIARQAL